ncbi:hypothetical protein [Dongia mobilis]|jgi:hypothetical protein|uniref:hypothetical protein n=1 Tax=Dongia sp. TaxID=1977262 RepID=UPI0026F364CD
MRFDIYQRGQRELLACKAGQSLDAFKANGKDVGIGEGWELAESGVGNVRFANGSKSARQIEDDVIREGRSLYSRNRVAKTG